MLQPFSTSMQQQLNKDNIKLAYFVEIDLNPQVLVHSGVGTITHNNKDYVGVGILGNVSTVRQTGELEANAITLELSALDSSILTDALTEQFSEKDVRIYLGALDANDNHKVLAFDLLFSGFVSDVNANLGQNNSVSLSVSNKVEKWKNGKSDRFSDESHLSRNPNDHFFKFLAATSTMDIRWGNTSTSTRARY